MSGGAPPLEEGEAILFDHIPSHAAFRRTALILLGVTLLPTVVFAAVLPGTIWPALPLFVTCVMLLQERVTLGRHRAWITNRRIVLQRGRDIPLWDVTGVGAVSSRGVRVRLSHNARGVRLHYAADPEALARAILDAREAAAT